MKRPPDPNFGRALRAARRARGLPQEEFYVVSGRTYVSALERGIKQPTIGKVAELANVMGLHPLTLLTLSFCAKFSEAEVNKVLSLVAAELTELIASFDAAGLPKA